MTHFIFPCFENLNFPFVYCSCESQKTNSKDVSDIFYRLYLYIFIKLTLAQCFRKHTNREPSMKTLGEVITFLDSHVYSLFCFCIFSLSLFFISSLFFFVLISWFMRIELTNESLFFLRSNIYYWNLLKTKWSCRRSNSVFLTLYPFIIMNLIVFDYISFCVRSSGVGSSSNVPQESFQVCHARV